MVNPKEQKIMRLLAEPEAEKPSLYKQKIVGIIQGL